MSLRRYIISILLILCGVLAIAQEPKKFDPAQFEANLEQFVATEARLTPAESAEFFPLYREMRKKQMAYFSDDRRWHYIDEADDKACADAIRQIDNNDIEIKRLQQAYHEKFLHILPASKVYRIIKAEDKFHRQQFKRIHANGKRHRQHGAN
ncbi:hypothetical protein [uncultured Prevotella sp.]|uniref:hypothetical protein n=1 Tax=uncultured Prevotella sp. TaxID=159272 RepID=UPI0027E33B86|nr:hypothetical protein [uncultured Prevotella sp.]